MRPAISPISDFTQTQCHVFVRHLTQVQPLDFLKDSLTTVEFLKMPVKMDLYHYTRKKEKIEIQLIVFSYSINRASEALLWPLIWA